MQKCNCNQLCFYLTDCGYNSMSGTLDLHHHFLWGHTILLCRGTVINLISSIFKNIIVRNFLVSLNIYPIVSLG